MSASKDEGKAPTDRPGDKREPGPAPAKPGATGSSVIAPTAAKPASAQGGGAPKVATTATSIAALTGAKAATPSSGPTKPGATDSSAIKTATSGTAGSTGPAGTPQRPAPAKPGGTDSSVVTAKSHSEAGPIAGDKPAIPSTGAAKPGATGSSAVSAGAAAGTASTDASAKPSTAGSGSGPPGGAQTSSKPDAAKSAAGPQVATRLGPDQRVTDGPILDMKAKRIPEPAAAPFESRSSVSDDRPPSGFADPAAPGRGLGFSAVLASGLLGGIVGAVLVFTTLQWGANGPRQDVRADSAIEARLTALDRRIGGLATSDGLTALDSRVAANERAVKGLPEAVKTASDRAEQALQKAASAPVSGGGTAAPASTAVPNDLVARLDALDQRVSALQEEPGRDQPAGSKTTTTQAGDESMRVADLEERLKAIEAKAEAEPQGPSPELTQKLAALQAQVEGSVKANESADQGLGQRLEQLQQALDTKVGAATAAITAAADSSRQAIEADRAQAAQAVQATDKRLQEQAARLAALDETVAGSAKAASLQAIMRAVAAGRIADALDRGAPFAEALTSLRAAGPVDPKQLATLESYAEAGAPTAAALAAAFRPVSEGIAAARHAARAKTVAETGSVSDRLMSMAESVVQVKRVGGPAPQGAAAGAAAPAEPDPVATVQEALDRGRIVEAARAFAALPEDVRGQAQVFGNRLKSRADAALAAQALQTGAFQALAPTNAGR